MQVGEAALHLAEVEEQAIGDLTVPGGGATAGGVHPHKAVGVTQGGHPADVTALGRVGSRGVALCSCAIRHRRLAAAGNAVWHRRSAAGSSWRGCGVLSRQDVGAPPAAPGVCDHPHMHCVPNSQPVARRVHILAAELQLIGALRPRARRLVVDAEATAVGVATPPLAAAQLAEHLTNAFHASVLCHVAARLVLRLRRHHSTAWEDAHRLGDGLGHFGAWAGLLHAELHAVPRRHKV